MQQDETDSVKLQQPLHQQDTMLKADCKKIVTFLITLTILFPLHALIEFIVITYNSNMRCILFGQIFEMKRVFIDGHYLPCWIFIIAQFVLMFISIYFAYLAMIGRKLFIYRYEHRLLLGCFIVGLLSAILFDAGYFSLCNSLDFAPVCNAETVYNIEFKYFKPKYLNISDFPSQFDRITISIWLDVIVLALLSLISFIKTRHPKI